MNETQEYVTSTKTVVNPDTGQQFMTQMPAPESVRQAILKMDFPMNGIQIKGAARILAEAFSLSDEQTRARNGSNLNFFRHNVVSPQFKYLLEVGKLEQPEGPRTPYFLAESSSDLSDIVLREISFLESEGTSAVEMVERTAGDPATGEEYQIQVPTTPLVKEALLGYEYPASGIQIKDIAEALAGQFGLSKEQSEARGKYGFVWKRHVNAAVYSLVSSGQLLKSKRGRIINPVQLDAGPLDVEISDADAESPFSDGETFAPEVVIAQNYRDHLDRLKEDLLQEIMNNPPEFFEELVLDLLFKMGYCGSRADAEAVGRSGDGGIDGIINQDPLGLDAIYVQAKQWENRRVRPSDIREFSGALTSTGALKGVFITTSDFTEKAKEAANESAGPKIVLIDGKQLVQLMIGHNVGISLGNFYQLKEVDMAYFTMDDAGENDTVDDAGEDD